MTTTRKKPPDARTFGEDYAKLHDRTDTTTTPHGDRYLDGVAETDRKLIKKITGIEIKR